MKYILKELNIEIPSKKELIVDSIKASILLIGAYFITIIIL